MKVYLEGSPDEINQILYGGHDDFEDTPVDDDEEKEVILDHNVVAEVIRNALENLKTNKAD